MALSRYHKPPFFLVLLYLYSSSKHLLPSSLISLLPHSLLPLCTPLPAPSPPNEGSGDDLTSSRQVDFVDVGGRISGEDNKPPAGDDDGDTEGWESRDKDTGGGASNGDGGGSGGGGGEGDAPDSKDELLEPSDDKVANSREGDVADGGEQGGADAGAGATTSSEPTEDEHDSGVGEPSVAVNQDPGPAANDAGDGGLLGGAVLNDLDPDTVKREERRARLNGHVEAAVSRQSDHACNVAFVKTHKTASTTLAGVLYRYGLRHGRRVARFQVEGTAVTLEHAVKEVSRGLRDLGRAPGRWV